MTVSHCLTKSFACLTLLVMLVVPSICRDQLSLKQLLDALNKLRTNPSYYATFINNEYKAKTNNSTRVHSDWNLQFNEATPGVFDNAISFLNSQTAIAAFNIDLGMTYATWKHVKYLWTINTLDHTGANGTNVSQRLNEYGAWGTTVGENLLYNTFEAKGAEHVNVDFVIDDGVSGRGHRTNDYNTAYTKVGLGLYRGTDGKEYYGIAFAGSYTCSQCSSITCAMQLECGWTKYLSDAGIADPTCNPNNNTNFTNNGTNNGTNNWTNNGTAGLGSGSVNQGYSTVVSGSAILDFYLFLLMAIALGLLSN